MNKIIIIASAFLFGVAFASGVLAAEDPGAEINPVTAPELELKHVEGGGGEMKGSEAFGEEINPVTTPERHMTEGKKGGKSQMKVTDEVKKPGSEIDPVTAPNI